MSRKQALKLKKEQARLEALEGRLERLYRQGADDEFLELAQGRARDLSPASAERYGQVVDRALRRALAGADLPRLGRLLARIGRDARMRPLAALAETVLHLAEGRLDEARAGLATLAPEAADGAPWLPGLAAALAALCPPEAAGALPVLADCGGIGAPGAQAVQRFYRALEAVQERQFRPDPAEVEELRHAAGALRTALPADPAVGKLLDAAEARLRLLADLAGLEEALVSRQGAGLLPYFLERVRGLSRSLLAALRDGPPDGLLRPLRHALRLRWRNLLALVAEREGAAAWAGLHAAMPTLFAVDLEIAGGAERLKSWAALREVREAGDHRRLAGLLASLSGAETAPERTALLWSLELWAWERAADTDDEEDDDEPIMLAEPPEHAALVRLGRMAGDIAGRLPAEQRPEAARFLRARLFDLCERQFFCDHAMEAAAALLRHLPDDPGLLLVALTGAASVNDTRAQGLFAARVAARGEARTTDRETVLRLVSQIVLERAEVLVRILPSLRLLLGEEAWPQAREILLQAVVDLVCGGLDRGYDETALRRLHQELETYRAFLAERPELAAVEAALDCARPGSGGEQALRRILRDSPQLETALAALSVLTAAISPWAPPAVDKAFGHAREAVISRLDLRWRLWSPVLPGLLIGAGRSQVRQLRGRIGRLLRSAGLQEVDRQALEAALTTIADLQRLESAIRRASPKPDQDRKRRKRRRKAEEDQLSFF
jgi:hypothetical protein